MPKCKVCKEPTKKRFGLTYACGLDHAVEYAQRKANKKWQAEARKAERELKRLHREQKEKVRPLKWYLDKTQETFNAYIRAKNPGASCISCGAPDTYKTHQSGHFRPAGINTALRFHENNCWPQCLQCNLHKSGNVAEYRRRLAVLIGEEAVCELEQNNEVKKWTREELIEIRNYYKAKLLEIKSDKH